MVKERGSQTEHELLVRAIIFNSLKIYTLHYIDSPRPRSREPEMREHAFQITWQNAHLHQDMLIVQAT